MVIAELKVYNTHDKKNNQKWIWYILFFFWTFSDLVDTCILAKIGLFYSSLLYLIQSTKMLFLSVHVLKQHKIALKYMLYTYMYAYHLWRNVSFLVYRCIINSILFQWKIDDFPPYSLIFSVGLSNVSTWWELEFWKKKPQTRFTFFQMCHSL